MSPLLKIATLAALAWFVTRVERELQVRRREAVRTIPASRACH